MNEPNPFHKPSKSRASEHKYALFINLCLLTGGSVIEETDEGKKVLRPFNANEINKSNPEDEEMPQHSLVTASIMAQ